MRRADRVLDWPDVDRGGAEVLHVLGREGESALHKGLRTERTKTLTDYCGWKIIISDNIRPSTKIGGQLVALTKDSRCMHLELLREVNPAVEVTLWDVRSVVDEGNECGGVSI